jgi:predicted nuclease with TOPRIM domain
MACCGPEGLNIDFTKEKYKEIKLNINENILKFDPEVNYGVFALQNKKSNEDTPQVLQLRAEINELNNIIKSNDVKTEKLNSKIKEIDDKIEVMNKILNVDISEREYLNYLASKISIPQDKI